MVEDSALTAAQQQIDLLNRALITRAQIEQAKGMLMYALDCDADVAFSVLAEMSHHEATPLAELAHLVVGSLRQTPRLEAAVRESFGRVTGSVT